MASSKLLQGTLGAVMALETACAGSMINMGTNYEVAVPVHAIAEQKRSLEAILKECDKFNGDIHKCFSEQDQTLVSFANVYRDHAEDYEKKTSVLPNGFALKTPPKKLKEKVAKEKPLSILLDASDRKTVKFAFPTPEDLPISVSFHTNGTPYELEKQTMVKGPEVTADHLFYSAALKRTYFKGTKTVSDKPKEGFHGLENMRMVLKDGTEMEGFADWEKKQNDAGKKVTLKDYMDVLAPKMVFPIDFYSFSKLCGRDAVTYAVDKGATAPEQVWKSAFLFQEILQQQGMKVAVIDPAAFVGRKSLQKIPAEFRYPLAVWMTKRQNGKFDINYANLLNVGRNGIEYNPETDMEGNEQRFFDHDGFVDEKEAVQAGFKLAGRNITEANDFYDSNFGLWSFIGKKLYTALIGSNGRMQYQTSSLSDLQNF